MEYKPGLAAAGVIQGTSHDKVCQELGLEPLKSIRWYKNISFMLRIIKEKAPNCLMKLDPKCETNTRIRNNSLPTFNCRTDCFGYSFFLLPSMIGSF